MGQAGGGKVVRKPELGAHLTEHPRLEVLGAALAARGPRGADQPGQLAGDRGVELHGRVDVVSAAHGANGHEPVGRVKLQVNLGHIKQTEGGRQGAGGHVDAGQAGGPLLGVARHLVRCGPRIDLGPRGAERPAQRRTSRRGRGALVLGHGALPRRLDVGGRAGLVVAERTGRRDLGRDLALAHGLVEHEQQRTQRAPRLGVSKAHQRHEEAGGDNCACDQALPGLHGHVSLPGRYLITW